MNKTFFISDLHLGHKSCLDFDDRPFESLDEQDIVIKDNWNNQVDKDDTVWILGDISWYSPQKTVEIFNQLNGTKKLCVGNHDHKLLKNKAVRDLFAEIVDYKELAVSNKETIILCHYPIPCFNRHYYGTYHLYGHVHNSMEEWLMKKIKSEMNKYNMLCYMYNVGCMKSYINYTPRTLEEIINWVDVL